MKKRILAAVVAAAMLLTAMLPCALAEREDKKGNGLCAGGRDRRSQ